MVGHDSLHHAESQVAQKLAEFPKQITMDPKVLKEVNAMEGVGKGSMEYVSAFARDG